MKTKEMKSDLHTWRCFLGILYWYL